MNVKRQCFVAALMLGTLMPASAAKAVKSDNSTLLGITPLPSSGWRLCLSETLIWEVWCMAEPRMRISS